MIKRILLLACLFLGLSLVGCSSNSASKSNFTKTLNQFLSKQNPACIAIDLHAYDPNMNFWGDSHALEKALMQQGLLNLTKHKEQVKNLFSNSTRTVEQYQYQLTDKAKPFVAVQQDLFGAKVTSLCYATPKIVKIINFTKPTPDNGKTVSEVSYEYALKDVASWARAAALQHWLSNNLAWVDRTQRMPLHAKAKLIQMQNGWEVAPDLLQKVIQDIN